MFTPSAEETALVDLIFAEGEPHRLGILPGDVALGIFNKTNLRVEDLAEIWAFADSQSNGCLTPAETATALRLIGWAQVGVKPAAELLAKSGPLARIPGLPIPESPAIPPCTLEDKARFLRLFHANTPVDGLIPGGRAREFFAKSKLPADKLSRIWELSDTTHRNALDSTEFAIAMHLIQGIMNNRFTDLPAVLPEGLYEQAAAEPPPQTPLTPNAPELDGIHLAVPTHSSSRRRRSSSASSQQTAPSSPDDSRLSGQRSTSSASSQNTSLSSPDGTPIVRNLTFPPMSKSFADRQFDALDPLNNGFIHDNISLPFLLESKLPPDDLARIWSLADVNNDGKLTRDGFAIALYLIGEQRRGKYIPPSPSLTIPSSPSVSSPLLPFPPSPLQPASPPPPMVPPRPGKGKEHHYPREKNAFAEQSGDALFRRASVIYPSLSATPSHHRFSSVSAAKPLPDPYASDVAISRLTDQVQVMQKLISELHQSHTIKTATITNLNQENVSLRVMVEDLQLELATNADRDHQTRAAVSTVLVRENEGLRTSMQEMKETLHRLEASTSEVEMQRIQYEDLVRENERLTAQVQEMRESTTQLPWSDGDAELQDLINHDLAHENRRLRVEAQEAQETLVQLQEATAGYEEQQRLNDELTRDNTRLQEEARTAQARFDTQRRELRQLSREIDRLKTQLRTHAAAGPSGAHDGDVPPPSYEEAFG
ncbi:hypothetical protein FB45DRAFT_1054785 [Roridomyces roridus]|uniref:Uncharacterized protein n=1 Tax=Roridomyces roridus TaxID=1738132 RepID=A0AAD7FR05_9AGAR|nr:hypothetical protein FB45DRAFT_1054785 [Roridomyces roridus]